jgi:hypothetical protein
MSFRALIIPEDPTNNGYILRPLMERMLQGCGRPNAKVTVLTSPRLQGYAQARRAIEEELVGAYSHFDIWVFAPDADVAAGLVDLENRMRTQGVSLFCCAARPETESWLLAGHRDKLSINWGQVATHANLKEQVFEPFLRQYGTPERAGGGRDLLMRQTLAGYDGLMALCPELANLQERLRDHIGRLSSG